MSPLYQSKVVWTNENRVMGQRSSILCYTKKWNGGNSLPTKMGGDFPKLCVALILAFIRTHQLNLKLTETCQNG